MVDETASSPSAEETIVDGAPLTRASPDELAVEDRATTHVVDEAAADATPVVEPIVEPSGVAIDETAAEPPVVESREAIEEAVVPALIIEDIIDASSTEAEETALDETAPVADPVVDETVSAPTVVVEEEQTSSPQTSEGPVDGTVSAGEFDPSTMVGSL